MTIDAFIKSLASYEGALTFNPWKDTDLRYEVENAPSIRKEQLHDYLSRRVGKAKLLLIAEACGYQGGHFTGIAMTAHDTKRASRSKQPHDPRERGKTDKQERFSHDCKTHAEGKRLQ